MHETKEKKAIQVLSKLGYDVKLSKPVIKKTFVIEQDTLRLFEVVVKKEEIKIKEAVTEALNDWIEKKNKTKS